MATQFAHRLKSADGAEVELTVQVEDEDTGTAASIIKVGENVLLKVDTAYLTTNHARITYTFAPSLVAGQQTKLELDYVRSGEQLRVNGKFGEATLNNVDFTMLQSDYDAASNLWTGNILPLDLTALQGLPTDQLQTAIRAQIDTEHRSAGMQPTLSCNQCRAACLASQAGCSAGCWGLVLPPLVLTCIAGCTGVGLLCNDTCDCKKKRR